MRRATHRLPGLVLTEHVFDVPLDHGQPEGARLAVFAREVVAPDRERDDLPWLLFLQGGPGYESPRPMDSSGWIGRATEEFRVLLLDQRGTGLSSPVDAATLEGLSSPEEQAAYLRHFRADAIVRDCELLRAELAGDRPWSVLGQSYGGFCATHYLCAAPAGLREVLIAGGLPPLVAHPDEVYRRTYRHCLEKNRRYDERYPDDRERVRAIAHALAETEARLPSGDRLTPRRFQTLGSLFGFSDGFETVHYLVEKAFRDTPRGPRLSHGFLKGFEGASHFDTNPIYSLLHEACYTQGAASRWSAERVRAEHAEFDPSADPLLFTGEMIYPWFFEEIGALRPLARAAEILAAEEGWPVLYDRELLERNTVPAAAVVYHDDMYVDRELSLETAESIRGLRVWVTNELEHNGLRAQGEKVLSRLLDLARGR